MLNIRLILLMSILVVFAVFPPGAPEPATDDSAGNRKVLKSASELDYPPFALVNPDGTADGFSVDLLKATAEAAGLSVTFRVGPWNELKKELANRNLDVLPLVSYSPERDQLFDFTTPYLRMNGTVFIRKGDLRIKDLSDLQDKEVIVMEGDTAHEYVIREQLSNKIIPAVSYEEAFNLLAAGEHDAVVVQQIVGLQMIKKLHLTNIVPVYRKHISTLKPVALKLEGFEQKFCFAVPEGNLQLISMLNEGLTVIYLNGTYHALYEKWFAPILPGPEIRTAEIIKKIIGVVVPMLLVFTVFGLWFLKRLVAERTGFLEREILQRKEIETELAEANAKYMKAQQLGKVGNWEYTVKTKAFWGSAEAARIFGFPVDGIFSVEAVQECIPDLKPVEQALRNLFENDRAASLEFDIKTCDTKERRTILFLAEPEKDDSGRAGKIRGVIQDITERKKAEKALQKSERLLMEMGSIARIGGWEHDLLNNSATWTKEIFKIVEIESGIAPGPDEHLNYYPPEDRAVLEKAYRRAVETGEPFDLELQCYSANRRLFWARAVGRPEFKCGRCIKMLGTFQDITQQKEMEQRLQQAQKLEALGVLSGGIAHDFNNILTAILGFTELIRDTHPADRQLQEDLAEIDTAGRRAKELVQQILTFSRKQSKTSSPLQIQPLVKEALKLIRSTLPASIEMQVEIAEEMGMVMANPTQVHQIVMNICTNAGNAMDGGGILRVKVFESTPSAQFFQKHPFLSPGRYIELQFADTGRGIAPEIMGYIFDPYFTTKNLGDGTGLGLAVTYGIVKEMAGEILVVSEQGTGSVFTIFLPVAETKIPAEVTSVVADDQTQLEGNERILLVDDEPQLLKLTSRILKQYGYAVTTARDGMSALARFKRNPLDFDMVISDIGMPGLTGDKLAWQIMSIRPTMPVVLISGCSRNVSEESVVRNGVKGLLQKPVSGEQLVRKVRQVLDKV